VSVTADLFLGGIEFLIFVSFFFVEKSTRKFFDDGATCVISLICLGTISIAINHSDTTLSSGVLFRTPDDESILFLKRSV
jgi:hypothetical protein